MKIPLRPTHLLVNLTQLRRNLEAIRAHVCPAQVLVMLKANAYGHGVEGVAPYIEPYVDYIGVAVLDEGVRLRQIGITKPILVAGGTLPEHVPYYLEYDLTLTVSHPAVLEAAEAAAQAQHKPLKVHLKIDTGMERAGIRWYEADNLLERSLRCRHLDIEGIYTHFANSEARETPGAPKKWGYAYPSEQLERFRSVLAFYDKRSLPRPRLVHAANSGAILNLPESFFDMVRPGILFYGIYPDKDVLRSVQVKPAATWKSQVVYSKLTQAGHPVSYGSLWVSDHPVRTVTIPCGYADGYFRRMTNRPQVIVNGKKYQQVGRICMDQFMVNLESDEAELGDEVILLGQAASGEQILPEDLAEWAGTNAYEVMTNISARVPRIFFKEDE
ncbi:MAG: alanine racemase [Anaerolineales bacterium]|nr:alanine racemase [Anaerolineales bacterium]MCX7755118.1 alanine racemase [Anaerolineales bacterium]MDW8277529.1 alanine racemase [Anaerolineales bacterium]